MTISGANFGRPGPIANTFVYLASMESLFPDTSQTTYSKIVITVPAYSTSYNPQPHIFVNVGPESNGDFNMAFSYASMIIILYYCLLISKLNLVQ